MRDYELTGFVNFPNNSKFIKTVDCGKTEIYLIAFGQRTPSQKLPLVGSFCGDDITPRNLSLSKNKKIDDVVQDLITQDPSNKNFYFKNSDDFPVISTVLIGWSKYSYLYTDRIDSWCCTFRDLTNEGKKLYYSLKKLHNDSEIRLLTFNNIK